MVEIGQNCTLQERQKAEGRRKEVLIKTKVAGYRATFKERIVSRRVARDTKRRRSIQRF